MEQGYCLSAESLLYAVLKLHKRGIYGVPNVMPKSSDKQFPEFAQQAEMELLNKGYGLMDFDGVFSLEDCFAELVSRCADCTGVIGTSLRRNGKWEKYTLYLDAGVLLERAVDATCTLRSAEDPVAELMKIMSLPDGDGQKLNAVKVDTDILNKRERNKLMEAGCSQEQADMILSGLDGFGGYAHVSCIGQRKRIGEFLLLYGSEGILLANAEYSEAQEFLRFSPVAKDLLRHQLAQWKQTLAKGVL